ncbi:MAG: alpha/beta fold hydrolase [Hyphomicrobiaceae bacterium]
MPDPLHESGFDSFGTRYARIGPADAPSVVMIHGLGMNRDFWQPQIVALARDCHVVVYDIIGHGESPMPDDDVAMDDMVAQLHGLLRDLEITQTHVIGHSMGALIATGFALAHPEQCLSLVAMNGVYDRPPEVRRTAIARAGEIMSGQSGTGNEITFRRWFGDSPAADQAGAIAWIRAKLEDNNAAGYGRIYRLFSESDDAYVGKLGGLACPALFLTGALDPNSTPEMSERMAAAAPDGRTISLDGERHMMSLVSPEETTAILREFLAEQHQSKTDAA